jgi:peptide deformylase
MAVLKITKLGNPILRNVSEPVDLNLLSEKDGQLQTFIDDMIETMHEEGGVGLAAPQVGKSLRILVMECEDSERYPDRDSIPLIAIINPEITYLSDEKISGWESCLSLIDFSGWVPRSERVVVEGFDREGKPIKIDTDDFSAIVLQHEIDHLDGIVFIDRMPDLTKLAYQEEFKTFWLDKEIAAPQP